MPPLDGEPHCASQRRRGGTHTAPASGQAPPSAGPGSPPAPRRGARAWPAPPGAAAVCARPAAAWHCCTPDPGGRGGRSSGMEDHPLPGSPSNPGLGRGHVLQPPGPGICTVGPQGWAGVRPGPPTGEAHTRCSQSSLQVPAWNLDPGQRGTAVGNPPSGAAPRDNGGDLRTPPTACSAQSGHRGHSGFRAGEGWFLPSPHPGRAEGKRGRGGQLAAGPHPQGPTLPSQDL